MRKYNYFHIFCKKHWWLYCFLSFIPIVSLILLYCCFPKDDVLTNFGAWATIISGLLAYIGSSFISVLLFYNTWSRQYREEKLDYSIDLRNIIDGNIRHFHSFEDIPEKERKFKFEFNYSDYISKKKYEFVRLELINRNKSIPIQFQYCYSEYSIDEQPMQSFYGDSSILSNFNIFERIENENNIFYIGINHELLKPILNVDEFHTININLYFHLYNNSGYEEHIKFSVFNSFGSYQVSKVSKNFLKNKNTDVNIFSNVGLENFKNLKMGI